MARNIWTPVLPVAEDNDSQLGTVEKCLGLTLFNCEVKLDVDSRLYSPVHSVEWSYNSYVIITIRVNYRLEFRLLARL
jgi:hypothetical protein